MAAEKAVQMLGAKPINSCEVPMVVSSEIGDDLTWIQSTGCPKFSVESVNIGGV